MVASGYEECCDRFAGLHKCPGNWCAMDDLISKPGSHFTPSASKQNGHACSQFASPKITDGFRKKEKIIPVHSFLMAACLYNRSAHRAFKYVQIYKQEDKRMLASENITN